jgi:hypothetical protein
VSLCLSLYLSLITSLSISLSVSLLSLAFYLSLSPPLTSSHHASTRLPSLALCFSLYGRLPPPLAVHPSSHRTDLWADSSRLRAPMTRPWMPQRCANGRADLVTETGMGEGGYWVQGRHSAGCWRLAGISCWVLSVLARGCVGAWLMGSAGHRGGETTHTARHCAGMRVVRMCEIIIDGSWIMVWISFKSLRVRQGLRDVISRSRVHMKRSCLGRM